MVIDTSALVAMLLDEPERAALAAAIEADPRRLVSAATLVEAGIVLEARLGRAGADALDLLLQRAEIQVVALDREQAELARRAWRSFGKGNDPAGLNLGDCFAYALASAVAEPLLFKGEDFARTDVPAAAGR